MSIFLRKTVPEGMSIFSWNEKTVPEGMSIFLRKTVPLRNVNFFMEGTAIFPSDTRHI